LQSLPLKCHQQVIQHQNEQALRTSPFQLFMLYRGTGTLWKNTTCLLLFIAVFHIPSSSYLYLKNNVLGHQFTSLLQQIYNLWGFSTFYWPLIKDSKWPSPQIMRINTYQCSIIFSLITKCYWLLALEKDCLNSNSGS
jgi:hypothetical protein